MTVKKLVGGFALAVLISACFVPAASAQYSASGDVAFASKYIWRGTRATDDPVIQPSMTLSAGGFSFNAWGNLDLTDVNLSQGKFTEIDYTASYDHSFSDVSVTGGLIVYTFDWIGYLTTEELYGGVTFDNVMLSPSVTVYIDVDETSYSDLFNDYSSGVYVLLAAGHSFETGNDVVPSIDVSGSFAFANSSYTNYYFGVQDGGATDAFVGLSVPFVIDDNWSASAFVNYSGLVRDVIRANQYTPNGADDADTVWGGVSVSLGF